MSPDPSRIAELNDLLRTTFATGRVGITAGVAALPDKVRERVLARVRSFDAFTLDNDPHGEHDFGLFVEEGAGTVFWSIAYYDDDLRYHSVDPADPKVTCRVLTIMLASEW